jgi:rhodanese-related sulfurtransferase
LVSRSPDELVDAARTTISRVQPADLAQVAADGGLIVDIRPAAQRASEGELPGAIVIERNVLEWRLDPAGSHRLPMVRGADQAVIVVCSEGYASSLAAAVLAEAGHTQVADLAGGYQAWLDWSAAARGAADGSDRRTPPRRFAESYVEIVNRGAYSELGDLFAEDAHWLGPNRHDVVGRAGIRAFYERFLGEITPQIRIAHYVEAADECVYELEARSRGEDQFSLGAIDHASLGPDGLVRRFSVFTK